MDRLENVKDPIAYWAHLDLLNQFLQVDIGLQPNAQTRQTPPGLGQRVFVGNPTSCVCSA